MATAAPDLPAALITNRIAELGGWRGKALTLIREAVAHNLAAKPAASKKK